MSAAYFEAAIPEPYRILGLKLRPFSLGHYLTLRRMGCVFVSDKEEEATVHDLVLGVLVCSMSHKQFMEFIEQGDCEKQVEEWGGKAADVNLQESCRLFGEYLKTGSEVPEFWLEQDDGAQSGAHWSHMLMTTLRSSLGYSRAEALDSPLSQSLLDFYKHAENLGIVRLMTEAEKEASGA
jgi:hypothetical protein